MKVELGCADIANIISVKWNKSNNFSVLKAITNSFDHNINFHYDEALLEFCAKNL